MNYILRISNYEQYIILTRTEEGHEKDWTNLNFSLQKSCTPQVLNDIRTANVHNRPQSIFIYDVNPLDVDFRIYLLLCILIVN